MTHIATRKPGTMTAFINGEVKTFRVNAAIFHNGVVVSEVQPDSPDDGVYDLIFQISDLIQFESDRED